MCLRLQAGTSTREHTESTEPKTEQREGLTAILAAGPPMSSTTAPTRYCRSFRPHLGSKGTSIPLGEIGHRAEFTEIWVHLQHTPDAMSHPKIAPMRMRALQTLP